jgi:Domain of unknown function (DUF4388)
MGRSRAAEVDTAQLSGLLGPALPPLAALQVCHVAEMTGTLRARSGPRSVNISFRAGEVVDAASLDCSGLDALLEFGRWSEGRFDFVCGAPTRRNCLRICFAGLMLELCRRLDESRSRAS